MLVLVLVLVLVLLMELVLVLVLTMMTMILWVTLGTSLPLCRAPLLPSLRPSPISIAKGQARVLGASARLVVLEMDSLSMDSQG